MTQLLVPQPSDPIDRGRRPTRDVLAVTGRRDRRTDAAWRLVVLLVVTAAAALFVVRRPGVNDIWAARARAEAVRRGAGLTTWFDWFAGGATPGRYSLLSPFVSALIGSELTAALCAVGIVAVTVSVVGGAGTRARLVCVTVAVGVLANLWSGRVAFLLGALFAVIAVVCVMRCRGPWWTALAVLSGVCSLAGSPVAACFLLFVLAPVAVLDRDARRRAGVTVFAVCVAGGAVTLAFGTSGPEPFTVQTLVAVGVAAVAGLMTDPGRYGRVLCWATLATDAVLYTVPNSMGSNFLRWTWFVLPVVIVMTSRRAFRITSYAVLVMAVGGIQLTCSDVINASTPYSNAATFRPLRDVLSTTPDIGQYRVEVVTPGAHGADRALIGVAALARGWETQTDARLNPQLVGGRPLSAPGYRRWLDANAVGYVAVARRRGSLGSATAEARLLAASRPAYLHQVWTNDDFRLYRVERPTPIVQGPARLVVQTSANQTVVVPCTCDISIRDRYSRFLRAVTPDGVTAGVRDDGHGWTVLTTSRPGDYTVSGRM